MGQTISKTGLKSKSKKSHVKSNKRFKLEDEIMYDIPCHRVNLPVQNTIVRQQAPVISPLVLSDYI